MICPKCGHKFEKENQKEDRGENQKEGMIKKFSEGRHMSRAPFGYEFNLKEKMLVPAENSGKVIEIFEEFLKEEATLNNLAKKHNLSVNGLKKILRNFVYVGKVKFDGQVHEGKHIPLISTILFNHVQDKLDRLSKK